MRLRTLACVFAALFLSAPASAVTLIGSPQQTSTPFIHNVFHSSDALGGASGTILAWLDLDTSFGAANFWDLGTGDLEGNFDIFSDSALSTQIGTGFVSGNISPTALSDLTQNNVIVGTLTWSIDLTSGVGSDLYNHLTSKFGAEADDVWDGITQSFADVFYGTSIDGRTANTFANGDLTLWGTAGTFTGSSLLGGPGGRGGFGSSGKLGLDLVLTTPEPGTGLLVALGLSVLGGMRRRREA